MTGMMGMKLNVKSTVYPIPPIEQFFRLENIKVAPDLNHSQLEERFLAVGQDGEGRHLFIVFTFRTKNDLNYIRPISARYMHKREIERYEEAT